MEKSWESVGQTLQGLVERCRALGAAPNAEWSSLAVAELGTALRLAEAKERLVCDELLRQLVRENAPVGKLPPLRGYFCAMRCLCALDTLGILHAELRSRPCIRSHRIGRRRTCWNGFSSATGSSGTIPG